VVKEPIKPLSPEHLNAMPIKREIVLNGKLNITKEIVESALKKIGYKPNLHLQEDSLQIYSEKGRYSRLGVYVTHFSIILILIGAVVGIFFGFNASLNLLEGTRSPVAYARNGKEIPLGFEIACNDFETTFYENTDTPRSFKSWLTIFENGMPVKINGKEVTEIDVNSPLKYKGIMFYQSSYGFSPSKDSLFKISVTPGSGGKKEEIALRFGESFSIPGTNITGKIADFSPALSMDEMGRLFTYAQTMNNPAVFIEFTENGKLKYRQWILKRYPQTWSIPDGTVEFKDLWGAQYTGIQVRRDPGVWIVYLGCIVMSIGLYAAFFMSHARIWITLRDEKGGTKAIIAASTNKNKIAFEQKIEKLAGGLNG
jgi:cytochrome c biogenesis protein